MNEQETARTLASLLYIDSMAVRLYDEAIPRVDDQTAEMLARFRDDHQRHEQRLRELASAGGRSAEDTSSDVKSMVEEHSRVLRTSQGPDAVMEAMLIAERTTAAMYDAAEALQTTGRIAETIAQNHEDERRHVAFLSARVPEMAVAMTSTGSRGEHEISCMTGGLTDDRNPDDFE